MQQDTYTCSTIAITINIVVAAREYKPLKCACIYYSYYAGRQQNALR